MQLRWVVMIGALAGVGWLVAARLSVAQDGPPPLPKDNSPCLVCHINLEDEELVATHVACEITCMHCHGVSYEHRDDESHRTPPDVLFGRAEIDPFCTPCHAQHKDQAKVDAFLQEWQGKVRPNGRTIRKNAVCTDCHGVHTITPTAP